MSTEERYGTAVWEALQACTLVLADVYVQWATVGEVAKKAGVSRGTAKKYLDKLCDMSQARSMKFGSRTGYSVNVFHRGNEA
uniref:HTH iclR-type domain-containing protein n=1 Tax=uncultured prokaryote TaxID=198431 RepID=A0A0H5PYU3_9ZZZZ|nr:hypothetical protein [uncultured prokaryote]